MAKSRGLTCLVLSIMWSGRANMGEIVHLWPTSEAATAFISYLDQSPWIPDDSSSGGDVLDYNCAGAHNRTLSNDDGPQDER